METINKKLLIISLVFALFSTTLIYAYINQKTVVTENIQYVNVCTAANTIPARRKIIESDIKIIRLEKQYLNPKAVLNKSDLVGRRLKDSVIAGEQFLKDRIAEDGKYFLSFNIPSGMRAVSVYVNEQIETANLIRPGDFVDIIASFEKEEKEDKTSKINYPRVTRTIIQNVEVLALGQEQNRNVSESKELPKTVTLAVYPDDAEKLVYASQYAVIRMALRGVDDIKSVDTDGTLRTDLTSQKGVETQIK